MISFQIIITVDGITVGTLVSSPFNKKLQFKPKANKMTLHLQINTHTFYGEPPITRELVITKSKGTEARVTGVV